MDKLCPPRSLPMVMNTLTVPRERMKILLMRSADIGTSGISRTEGPTLDTFNTGESRGREKSHNLNYSKLGKDLASVDELAVLDGGKCILQLRGVRPFLSDKYDITKHPNYKYLSDYDPRNAFNIEKFLSTQLKPKSDEVYDVYEVDASEPSTTA